MSKSMVNVGSAPNDGTGEPLRTAFQKINTNFTEVDAEMALRVVLDANQKIPAQYLPPSSGTPHHIFATQADMLAGGAPVVLGERVLVHGDPAADNNGEYVALADAPTTLVQYDHLGEHVSAHRHDGADVDVTIAGHKETLTAGLTSMNQHLASALQQDGSVDAEGVPFVSLNTAQVTVLKANSIYIDETQKLMHKNNSGVSHPLVGPAHLHGAAAPDDADGEDGDLYFEV